MQCRKRTSNINVTTRSVSQTNIGEHFDVRQHAYCCSIRIVSSCLLNRSSNRADISVSSSWSVHTVLCPVADRKSKRNQAHLLPWSRFSGLNQWKQTASSKCSKREYNERDNLHNKTQSVISRSLVYKLAQRAVPISYPKNWRTVHYLPPGTSVLSRVRWHLSIVRSAGFVIVYRRAR